MSGFSEEPSVARSEQHEPPPAPTLQRRLFFTRKQRLGLPLLAAIPILSVLGVFGERRAEARATAATFTMTLRYPERFRYRQLQSLEISIQNVSAAEIDTVHVWLDTAYVTRFSSVRIEPPPHMAYAVDLAHVKSGESRLVSAELWGEQYGRHQGRMIVWTRRDTAAVSISTLVFP